MKYVVCIPRKPLSLNAKRAPNYQTFLHHAALTVSKGALLQGPLYSRVIWFHRYPSTQGDVDNILKPIHDSLKEAFFQDDHAIVRTAAFV